MIEILAWCVAFLFLAVLAGAAYQHVGTRRDAKRHPPPGRLVDIGTHRLHILESGNPKGPTVLLEAGLMSTVLSWSELQRELGESFRVVSYDRAGLGWSEGGPLPRTAERIVQELRILLEKADVPGPYVLVGHSFGGLTATLFAARFPKEVAAMVLVDPIAPMEWDPPSEKDRKLSSIGAKVCRRAAVLARIGVIRFAVLLLRSGLKPVGARLVRLISREAPAESGSISSPWFFALPAREREMAPVFWVQSKFAVTIASQLENLPVSAASVRNPGATCDTKVVILTANSASERRRTGHAEMARRLPRAEHLLVANGGHWIMHENRELVIRAIRRIAEGTRVQAAAQ